MATTISPPPSSPWLDSRLEGMVNLAVEFTSTLYLIWNKLTQPERKISSLVNSDRNYQVVTSEEGEEEERRQSPVAG